MHVCVSPACVMAHVPACRAFLLGRPSLSPMAAECLVGDVEVRMNFVLRPFFGVISTGLTQSGPGDAL